MMSNLWIQPESWAISKAEWSAWEHGRASRLHAKKWEKGIIPNQKYPGLCKCIYPYARHKEQKIYRIVVSNPREIKGREKGEGSLSFSIVPIESWEISPMKASE